MSRPPLSVLKLKDKLTKQYGEKSVMFASEIPQYEVVSSGSLALDYAIGIGGIPTNRAIEIGGEPGTGKTTLALHIVNNFLNSYPERAAVILDIENRLTADWVAAFVKDSERVIILKPDSMEKATDMYVDFVKTGEVSVVVVDSIGGAPTERVINKSAEIGDVGGNAAAVSRFARFAQTLSGKYDCATIGINQVRADMSGYNRYMCLTGDTKVLTQDGMKPIADLAAQGHATILTDGGKWVDAPVYEFGMDDIWEIDIARNGRKKTIRTNAGHRWPIQRLDKFRVRPADMAPTHEVTRGTCDDADCPLHGQCHCVLYCGEKTSISQSTSQQRGVKYGNPMLFVRGHGNYKTGLGHSPKKTTAGLSDRQFVTTEDLLPGDYLTTNRPAFSLTEDTLWHWAVARGFVFGDGTVLNNRSGVNIVEASHKAEIGEKYLAPFAASTSEGIARYYGFPADFKDLPSFNEPVGMLYSWLAGYIAADGSVNKDGICTLTSGVRANLEFVSDLCDRIGVTHGHISTRKYSPGGFGAATEYYDIEFPVGAFPEWFFLRTKHRENYKKPSGRSPARWRVTDVRKTDYQEKVYCAKVEGTETFTLEDYILTGNTPGGKAWIHAVSLRVELKKGKDKVYDGTGDDKVQVGNTVVARIHKNSLAAPYRTTSYWFYHVPSKYGFGIDQREELSRLSMLTGVVEQRAQGSYYHSSFPEGKIRGKDSVMKFLDENAEAFEAVRRDVIASLSGGGVDGVAQSFDGDNLDDNPADGMLPQITLTDAREDAK